MAGDQEDLQDNIINWGNYGLCSAHFNDKIYLNDLKTRLVPNAIPTIIKRMEGLSKGSCQEKQLFPCLSQLLNKMSLHYSLNNVMNRTKDSNSGRYSEYRPIRSHKSTSSSDTQLISPSSSAQRGWSLTSTMCNCDIWPPPSVVVHNQTTPRYVSKMLI